MFKITSPPEIARPLLKRKLKLIGQNYRLYSVETSKGMFLRTGIFLSFSGPSYTDVLSAG